MELAKKIGMSKAFLLNLSKRANKQYKCYWVPKKSGEDRAIESPNKDLKRIQKWILKNILEQLDIHSCAHGFVKNRSIKTNAKVHLGNSVVLCMDFSNFFPSISQRIITNILKKTELTEDERACVARLCCYDGRLPQGGVCSPYLSNLAMYRHDEAIFKYCSKNNIDYTRYADDLTFSCNDLDVLKKTEKFVHKYFESTYIDINVKKTRYYTGSGRVCVTGVNINTKTILTVPSKQKKRLKTLIHHVLCKGSKDNINEMLGLYRHVVDVQPSYKENLSVYIKKLKNKKEYSS